MRLAMISGVRMAEPVTFPPGRARLATRPVATGSAVAAITMGIVEVACIAACTLCVVCVTSTST